MKDGYIGGNTLSRDVPESVKVDGKRHVEIIADLNEVHQLSYEERENLERVALKFGFLANSYYLSLINWDDPDDPIRKMIIPDLQELDGDGSFDASQESKVTVRRGIEHKYERTALILSTRACGSICRFCFRKRLFIKGNSEIAIDLTEAFEYIRDHSEISNVLITGGDSLMLPTGRIARILVQLRAIPHVKSIRFGTRLLAINPFRIIDDPSLLELFRKYSYPDARIYIVNHFNHPREITDHSIEAVRRLIANGLVLLNQTPLLNGINDDPDILAELFTKLSHIGVAPYYIFQCRPTVGNGHFKVPFKRGIDIIEGARKQVSGLAKRARYVGSHATGKIEIIGYDAEHMYFKYLQSKDPNYFGQFIKLPRNDEAAWWSDWMPEGKSFTLESCPEVGLGSCPVD
ncbi:MAG: KamA family radical SAM protein [bacterium]